MFRIRRTLMAITALGALALGGSALANAASNGSSSSSGTTTQPAAPQGQAPNGGRPAFDPSKGGHVGRNGKTETLLTGDTAAKVKAAALAKVSGTVERVETDADHGSPYEAHIRKADGTEVEVLVNKDFEVTAVNTMQHP